MPANENFPLALPEGTILAGQYVIENVLGQGGFGITYKALDHKSGEPVAVKEFFPDTLAYREMTTVISYPGERSENYQYGRECFLQEAKTLAQFIGNENIVRIHSYFEENGTAYFVMDYIEGVSFDAYLKQKGGRLTFEETCGVLVPVMNALADVHSKGIIHRDVTPDNICITYGGKVKLLDFGAARYSLGDKSRSLDVILKHGFAPKEQYTRRGKQGPYTDVYSLGATFYFSLTGKRPPDSIDRLEVENDELIPPSTLGVRITEQQENALLKAMSVQPADRFQSMLDFRRALLNEPVPVNTGIPAAQSDVIPDNKAQNVINFEQPASQPAAPVYTQPAATGYVQPETPAYSQPAADIPRTMDVQPGYAAPQSMPPAPAAGQTQGSSKKALIIFIAVAAIMLSVVGIVIAVTSSGGSKVETADASADAGGDQGIVAPLDADSQGQETGTTTAPPVTTTAPPKETEPQETKPQTSGGASKQYVLGNNCMSISNAGIYTTGDGYDIFSMDNLTSLGYQSLNSNGEDIKYIFQNTTTSTFSNLSYIDGYLYFLYNSKAYKLKFPEASESIIPELSSYKDIWTMYITSDYYFIVTGSTDNFTLRRISRSTGTEEETLSVASFTVAINGEYIYYTLKGTNGNSGIGVSYVNDFSNSRSIFPNGINISYSYPITDGNYVYVLAQNSSNTYGICRYSPTLDTTQEVIYDISSCIDKGNTIQQLVVYGDEAFLISGTSSSAKLVHLRFGSGNSIQLTGDSLNNCLAPSVLYYNDGSFKLWLETQDSTGAVNPNWIAYDSTGNIIG